MSHDHDESPGIELLSIQDGFNSQHSHPTSHEQSPERNLDEPPPYTPSPATAPIPPQPSHLRAAHNATPPDILPTYTAARPPPGLPPPIYKARICGLQRRTFFLLAFALPAVILIIVAGTLGKILIHNNGNNNNINNNLSNSGTTPVSSSSPSGSASSGPQQTVSANPVGGTFTLLGCRTDAGSNPAGDRTFRDLQTFPQMPPYNYIQCAAACGDWNYFGTENSGQCFCGNDFSSDTVIADISSCDPNCAGGFCGAPNYMLVYQNINDS